MAGCAQAPEAAPDQGEPLAPTQPPPAATPELVLPTPLPTSVPEMQEPPTPGALTDATEAVEALAPHPQEVVFQAADGHSLSGRYYPAAVMPAPLVVLMHWAPGDQNEWNAIAAWMQNRGLSAEPVPGKPWLDAAWFPMMPEGSSLAVFTFTFRNCEGGCSAFSRAAWLLDARAAVLEAYELEGIDPNRIAAIGASIGADGAIDGCIWLNAAFPDSCQGALSLSPGGYLTIPYRDAVRELGTGTTPKPAWCLYAEKDGDSKKACVDASGENYHVVRYDGSDHGMQLIQPQVEPAPLGLMLDFLMDVFDL